MFIMFIDKAKLRKEIEEKLEELKEFLKEKPDIENFKNNWKRVAEENKKFDERINKMFNPTDLSFLFKLIG